MRRLARSDDIRALPPSEAMLFFSAADSLSLRARPPLLPRRRAISAISEIVMLLVYLALSTLSSECPAAEPVSEWPEAT